MNEARVGFDVPWGARWGALSLNRRLFLFLYNHVVKNGINSLMRLKKTKKTKHHCFSAVSCCLGMTSDANISEEVSHACS